jgi:hypothetical protein
MSMGILEIILGIILFILIANMAFSFIPIPRGALGTLVAILVLYFIWRLVF